MPVPQEVLSKPSPENYVILDFYLCLEYALQEMSLDRNSDEFKEFTEWMLTERHQGSIFQADCLHDWLAYADQYPPALIRIAQFYVDNWEIPYGTHTHYFHLTW